MGGWDKEYPRPMLRRDSFLPLNEGWRLNGCDIRLPWPPEAELSGFRGTLGGTLEYELGFTLPEGFAPEGFRLMLNFGAVDQTCSVELNGREVASHEGGYLPFSVDITEALADGENRLLVHATDTLDVKYPYGKQSARPQGMWYTPVSGIWQTVWLEAVPASGGVRGLHVAASPERVVIEVETDAPVFTLDIPAAGMRLMSSVRRVELRLPSPRLWSPEDPFLYDFTVTTGTDRVSSYFALRTVSLEDREGVTRLCLNGRPVYLHGVLDQGYFRDGIFLPRDPGEYERDILRMKELGFNTLRKHIKLEPEAFYYACDRLGMLVVQDMVNSGEYDYLHDTVLPTVGFKRRSDLRGGGDTRRKVLFERHMYGTAARLAGHPCIVGWTIFNEGWGQFDSDRLYTCLKAADRTRFVDSTSGWFAQGLSDAVSEHVYFRNKVLSPAPAGKFLFLSEFGGISRRVEGHVAGDRRNYGYGRRRDTEAALTESIRRVYRGTVLASMKNGLCGSIYTQLSDVEGETNGLYTYDRQVCKVDREAMRRLSDEVYRAFQESLK